jgi:outer membrane protein, heavy metal efflux system
MKRIEPICFSLFLIVLAGGCTSPSGVSPVPNEYPSPPAGIKAGPVEKEESRDFSGPVELSACLEYAALHNPGLEAAYWRWKAALEKAPQALALPDPGFAYTYNKEIESRMGGAEQSYSLTQGVPWFGKRELGAEAAGAEAQRAQQEYASERLSLAYRVKSAYYEYYYLRRSLAVTEENLVLLRGLEEAARMKYESGTGSQAAMLRFQVDIGRVEDRLRSLRDLQGPLAGKLNAAMNRAVEAPLAWPEALPETEAAFAEEQLLGALGSSNPELAALEAEIEKTRKERELAKKNYYPDFMLGVTYRDTRESSMPGTMSENDLLEGMAGITLPIQVGKYRAAEREAYFAYQAAVKARAEEEKSLGADLRVAIYEYRDAERKMDLYRNGLLPKAEQALQVVQQEFATGEGQFLDLIDAVRMLLEFQLEYERARVDRQIKIAEIEMLTGQLVSGVKTES